MKYKHLFLTIIIAGGFMFAAQDLCAQAAAPEAAKPGAPLVKKKTLFEQIKEGGWVMFPIAACSILTLYLIGDGAIRTGKKRTAPEQHEQALKEFFRQGDY